MPIDVGTLPDDFNTSLSGTYTVLNPDNPANADGYLDTVQVRSKIDITDLKVGTFYLVSGSVYKCRDSVSVGAVTAGANRTFSGLDIEVSAGDLIGCYYADGSPSMDLGSGGSMYYYSGECIDPNDQADFSNYFELKLALYGSGIAVNVRSAIIKLGVKPISYRTATFNRSAIIKIGTKVTSLRNQILYRTAIIKSGIKTSSTRLAVFNRSTLIKVGVKIIASKNRLFTRSTVIKIGVKVRGGWNTGRQLKLIAFTAQYRSVKVFTSMYRKIRNFLTRG